MANRNDDRISPAQQGDSTPEEERIRRDIDDTSDIADDDDDDELEDTDDLEDEEEEEGEGSF
jgi:hypothetical protein